MQFEDAQDQLDTWLMDKLPIARALRQSADRICNKTAKRLISALVNFKLPPLADDQQTNR